MDAVVVLFVVAIALVLASVCGLLVLRSLGTLELPESPPFPRRRARPHPHVQAERPAEAKRVVPAAPALEDRTQNR